jgi:hypothetical protein
MRNLLLPWFSCEQQIPHPQTTRVRDDKSGLFRSLLRQGRYATPDYIRMELRFEDCGWGIERQASAFRPRLNRSR